MPSGPLGGSKVQQELEPQKERNRLHFPGQRPPLSPCGVKTSQVWSKSSALPIQQQKGSSGKLPWPFLHSLLWSFLFSFPSSFMEGVRMVGGEQNGMPSRGLSRSEGQASRELELAGVKNQHVLFMCVCGGRGAGTGGCRRGRVGSSASLPKRA